MKRQVNIINYIPYGSVNAVSRRQLCLRTGMTDRAVRKHIQEAKRDFPIINMGNGYFIVDETNSKDVELARVFNLTEMAKLRESMRSLEKVRRAVSNADKLKD